MSRRRSAGSGYAMLLMICGCAGADRDAGSVDSFMERDSAGVAILTTPGPAAFAPLGWQVDSVPGLVLGSEDSPSGYFVRVDGVKALPRDEFLILDDGKKELLLFDGQGRVLASAGGTGQGPGEFIRPSLVPSASIDSVLVFDRSNLRLHVFSTDLQGSRTQPVNDWLNGRVPPIGAVGLRVLRDRNRFNGGTLESAMFAEGPVEESRQYFWYDPNTGAELELASFTAVRWYVSETHGEPGPLGHIPIRLVPVAPTPAAVTGTDVALLTDGRTYEVREFDPSGRLRRIFRVDDDPDPVTRDLVERRIRIALGTRSGSSRDRERAAYAEHPIPENQPAFRSLIFDTTGWLWAEVYEWDPEKQKKWVLFDAEGRARGTVLTPANLEVHAISRDHVFGVRRGEFDQEFVHSHRLRRSDG